MSAAAFLESEIPKDTLMLEEQQLMWATVEKENLIG